ncbi:esterase-like activity of phytase family protein [Alteraurantiacibacter buctensis]|uniref:Phytase-like domain-containing protein n=1 Tax=Alteraurantiacibacter buctensis TaxID=1503981 RepID=A0A844YWL2_9SPHN|nr:esterase-like activity of phytase family protein [Alteraurantiacibacter buctensis]MXO70457.1 hypothetical protein [Alteraurantiacibacter buctensis]
MRPRRYSALRLAAVLALGAVLAPGTWLRSHVPDIYTTAVSIHPLPYSQRPVAGLQVLGLWQLRGSGENFGGYSGMLILGRDAVRLFSDRNYQLNVPRPGVDPPSPLDFTTRRLFPVNRPLEDMFDIESVTQSALTGQYWVGYEFNHTIYRYGMTGDPEAYVEPDYAAGWTENGGIEAMVLLADGRFVVLREYGGDAYVYAGDPVEGALPQHARVSWPAGYSPTDAAELPDGRLIVVLRRVGWHLPVFESRLVLLDPVQFVPGEAWHPQALVQLEALLPRDNWEAIGVDHGGSPAPGAPVSLWLASDDNRSVFQRSLLAQLAFVPPPRNAGREP